MAAAVVVGCCVFVDGIVVRDVTDLGPGSQCGAMQCTCIAACLFLVARVDVAFQCNDSDTCIDINLRFKRFSHYSKFPRTSSI